MGFSPEQQVKHEQYLIDRFGDGMKKGIAESKQKVNWEKSGAAFGEICQDLVVLMGRKCRTIRARCWISSAAITAG